MRSSRAQRYDGYAKPVAALTDAEMAPTYNNPKNETMREAVRQELDHELEKVYEQLMRRDTFADVTLYVGLTLHFGVKYGVMMDELRTTVTQSRRYRQDGSHDSR